MLNKTDWDAFSDATGASLDALVTIEGVVETAKAYYEWTDGLTPDVPGDGKAFYGRDAMANYFIIGMQQQGVELFRVEGGEMTLNGVPVGLVEHHDLRGLGGGKDTQGTVRRDAPLLNVGVHVLLQLLFRVEGGEMTLNVPEDALRRLWENYYVPIGVHVPLQLLPAEVGGEVRQGPGLLHLIGGIRVGGEDVRHGLRPHLAADGVPHSGLQV